MSENKKMFLNVLTRMKAQPHIAKPVHLNGTVGTTKTKIELPSANNKIMSLIIKNTHESNVLSISFDGSANWFEIAASASLTVAYDISYFYLKGSGSDTTYQAIAGIEPTG